MYKIPKIIVEVQCKLVLVFETHPRLNTPLNMTNISSHWPTSGHGLDLVDLRRLWHWVFFFRRLDLELDFSCCTGEHDPIAHDLLVAC